MNLDTVEPKVVGNGDLLALWERCGRWNSARKSLELLAAGFEMPAEELAGLTVGTWNRALLRLREIHFGPAIHLTDRCPECSEPVEFQVSGPELLAGAPPEDRVPDTNRVDQGDWRLTFRPLTGNDILHGDAGESEDPAEAGKVLLGRALIRVERNGRECSPDDLSEEVWEAFAAALSEADPAAELVFNLTCPACDHHWESLFDPGDYLWRELAARARRILYQTHTIASAYGWSEEAILALSPERRSAYLVMIEEQGGAVIADAGATGQGGRAAT